MEITPNLADSERIARTMRVVSYEEAKAGVSHYIEEPLEEKGDLTDWDLSFAEFIEEHKNSRLLFCLYAKGVGIAFSPTDHRGIWVMQREGIRGKGILPEHMVPFLEALAKGRA